MNKIWVLAIGLFFLSALFVGVMIVAQSPNFWYGLLAAMVVAALPFFTKRMKPEDEKAWREAEKKGRGDEWRRHHLKFPPKG